MVFFRSIYFLLLIFFFNNTVAQTIPAAQLLPYNQNFNTLTHSDTTYPIGWQGWKVANTSSSTFRSDTPLSNRSLIANSSASTSTGNIHNYNGKIGMLNTGTLDLALVLALNTTNKSNILVQYDVMTIRNPFDSVANNRIREIALQYRTDTAHAFMNVLGSEYQNNTLKQNSSGVTTPQNLQTKTLVLPHECDSQAILQLRWISRDVSGAGSRPSFAIDNIQVDTSSVFSMSLARYVFEDSPSTPAIINFELSAPLTTPKKFKYSFNGSALFNVDYTASIKTMSSTISADNGWLTLDSGTKKFQIFISPINDTLVEGMEQIIFRIQEPFGGYAIKDSTLSIRLVDDEPTPINLIQGKSTTALSGQFNINAVVTGVYPKMSPPGFYVQEEDADVDTSLLTSEAIFVASDSVVKIGDIVWINAEIVEHDSFPSYGQATAIPYKISILGSGFSMPKAIPIRLPLASTTNWEQYEAMLLRFEDSLFVCDNENLGKYGELTLSANSLLFQPTQFVDPNDILASDVNASGWANKVAIDSVKLSNISKSILLDDGQTSFLTSVPFIDKDNTIRVGSRIDSLYGILAYAFDNFRVFPQHLADVNIRHAKRPSVPTLGSDENLKIASFNVLNFFNGDGMGAGFPTSRGASSLSEFVRQRDKIINAIVAINADLIGLIEIENDGCGTYSAVKNLVDGINAYKGIGVYSFVNDGADSQNYNTDQIRCAIIYKTAVLDTISKAILSSDTVFNRPPLGQFFRVRGGDSVFAFVINHFKSKGCTGAKGLDKDQNDGQSCFNDTRKQQANALARFISDSLIAKGYSDKILSLGDYNAYYEEDPLDTLRALGYTVLGTASEYSYLYQGQLGSLDNAFVSAPLLPYVKGVAKWNINSVEPPYLGYKDDVEDIVGDEINFWSYLYSDNAFRCSDHDPLLLAIDMGKKLSIPQANPSPFVKIYPNPAQDVLFIDAQAAKAPLKIRIYNALGQVILDKELPSFFSQLSISELVAGQYWLRVYNLDCNKVIPFFKK